MDTVWSNAIISVLMYTDLWAMMHYEVCEGTEESQK